MRVSPKAGVGGRGSSLFYSAMPSYLDTTKHVSICEEICGAGSGDRPSLSSSACSHVLPSSVLTIKYHLHFRSIQILELGGHTEIGITVYILSLCD